MIFRDQLISLNHGFRGTPEFKQLTLLADVIGNYIKLLTSKFNVASD